MRPLLFVLLALIAIPGCKKGGDSGSVKLNGAGATFPYPLYSKWTHDFAKTDGGVSINYQSIGSGGGIKHILDRTMDFGASDAPMTDEELSKAPAPIVHIPTALGAVVVTYNLEGVAAPLKLDPDVVADLFRGAITQWNDPRIGATNPGVALPAAEVTVIHRSDGSGTTAVFTDYLSKVSPTWKDSVGAGKSVKWPVGLGGKGNEGVTGQVKNTPGSIGYVELNYAVQNKMPHAHVKNAAGKYVEASSAAVSAAAAGAVIPDDFRVSITNAAGEAAYPISSFTYLLLFADVPDVAKGKAIARFVWWALHDGQKSAANLDYGPIPDSLLPRIETALKALKAGGQAAL